MESGLAAVVFATTVAVVPLQHVLEGGAQEGVFGGTFSEIRW